VQRRLNPKSSRMRIRLCLPVVAVLLLLLPCHFAHSQVVTPQTIEGANYVPAHAYNAFQMWRDYDHNETEHDFQLAQSAHLNAIRIWASYEYWQLYPANFELKFNDLLSVAREHGLRVLVSIFENDGVAPTEATENGDTTTTGSCLQSPGTIIATDRSAWNQVNVNGPSPQDWVEWFMDSYASEDQLLAIEIMNEPGVGDTGTEPFAAQMFQLAAHRRSVLGSSVKLTMGTVDLPAATLFEQGSDTQPSIRPDIIELHIDFTQPQDVLQGGALGDAISDARLFAQTLPPAVDGAPVQVWLTEWQRTRQDMVPPGGQKLFPTQERGPDYASMAAAVRRYNVGNFFWSLMVKPGYLYGFREQGVSNGLFWPMETYPGPGGLVSSQADFIAIVDDPSVTPPPEYPVPPNFFKHAHYALAPQNSQDAGASH
jgi:hypothetical protein